MTAKLTVWEWLNRWKKRVAVMFVICVAVTDLVSQSAQASQDGRRVNSLIVNRVNIFTEAEASANFAYRLLNRTHRTTLQDTIVRELGVKEGDFLDKDDLAELERNLRKLNLFASVSVHLIEEGDAAGTLVVSTRDLLSIVASADGSFIGGVGELGVSVGEKNLLGLGDNVSLSLRRNTDRELRGVLSYRDLHWLNADNSALYRVGATEEGEFVQLQFSRPFKTDGDPEAWNSLFENVVHEIDYYEVGQSVAQVPEQRTTFSGRRLWQHRYGSTLKKLGLAFQLGDYRYQAVRGINASTYLRPEDNSQLTVSVIVGRESRTSHRKVIGLDTLQYVQDLRLGRTAELEIGARLKRTGGGTTTLRPVMSGSLGDSAQLGEKTYTKLFANFTSQLLDESAATTALLGVKLYTTITPAVTSALRIDYNFADNTPVLPVQYTLGESNGLRGYDNRLLSGDKMLRVNLETRLNLPRRIGFLDVGLVGFFDAGWVSPENDKWKRSFGAGMRLGSNALLGRAVVRMDVAYPLDVESAEPIFSAALGQVFTF